MLLRSLWIALLLALVCACSNKGAGVVIVHVTSDATDVESLSFSASGGGRTDRGGPVGMTPGQEISFGLVDPGNGAVELTLSLARSNALVLTATWTISGFVRGEARHEYVFVRVDSWPQVQDAGSGDALVSDAVLADAISMDVDPLDAGEASEDAEPMPQSDGGGSDAEPSDLGIRDAGCRSPSSPMDRVFSTSTQDSMVRFGPDVAFSLVPPSRVEIWVRLNPSLPSNITLLSASGVGASWSLFIDGNDRKIRFFHTTGPLMDTLLESPTAWPDDLWHRVSFDVTVQPLRTHYEVRGYLDNDPFMEVAISNPWAHPPMTLEHPAMSNGFHASLLIDDLRISSGATILGEWQMNETSSSTIATDNACRNHGEVLMATFVDG